MRRPTILETNQTLRQRPRSSRVCPEIEFGNMTFSDPGDIANPIL